METKVGAEDAIAIRKRAFAKSNRPSTKNGGSQLQGSQFETYFCPNFYLTSINQLIGHIQAYIKCP